MYKRIKLFITTILYLQFIQIYYRFYYSVRNRLRHIIGFQYLLSKNSNSVNLYLKPSIETLKIYHDNEFKFLNKTYIFKNQIDWNYQKYGKLWTYNLTYFEFLNQEDISVDSGLSLINDFITNIEKIQDGLEPFPISLRAINWIKFLSKNKINNCEINNNLYAQYYILLDNLEYHLLGNHLLENAFSLLYGAYFFEDIILYQRAKNILLKELDEQILGDGAHFELSPMYHQVILFRLLDCVNLLQNNTWENQEILHYLEKKASIMLSWLKEITYFNGNIPLLNDSANKIAPTSDKLFDYANKLNILPDKIQLKESGYRKITTEYYECIIDIGNIGPDYIPGHAHADTFNFELYINKQPLIVDSGLSTYENNNVRKYQRSTKAHNTVEIMEINSSEMWDGFRVAERAKVFNITDTKNNIKATHDGYKKYFIYHTREFITSSSKITIIDTVESMKNNFSAKAYLHFYPNIHISIDHNTILVSNSIEIKIKGTRKISLDKYTYASEFNKLIDAQVVIIDFNKKLTTEINIKDNNLK